MAEQKKTRPVDLDRISSLEDKILRHIISFLPTEEAVGTSILSTRWRYLFASMSKFDFSNHRFLMKSGNETDPNKVDNFIHYVNRLMYYPSNETLECFRMTCVDKIDGPHVYNWILAALWRGVKELDLWLRFRDKQFLNLPPNLFTCKSLVVLRLSYMSDEYVLKVPINVCFPNLKILYLGYIVFSDSDSLRMLFSGCVALENAFILDCPIRTPTTELHISHPSIKRLSIVTYRKRNYSLVINAPSLVRFRYIDAISKHGHAIIRNMPSLIKATLSIRLEEFPFVDKCKHGANQLLQAIRNVESLRLTIEQPKELVQYPTLVFPNLVKLKILEGNNYNECWQGTWLLGFLRCTPNLKSLLISLEYGRDGNWSAPQQVPECLSQLMEIKMLKFNGDRRLIDMIAYFLMNAKVLERLTIRTYGLKVEEEERIYEELLKIPKRSSTCQVVMW